jgi:hypothetical protein
MRYPVVRMLTLLACLLVVYMAISVVANISQIANSADRISMGLGQPVFWTLLGVVAMLVIAPLAVFFRLPRPLIAPKEVSGPEHEKYIHALRLQLARNPLIAGMPLESEEEMAAAIVRLDKEANAVLRNTASAIFASTAVMQNGRLDGLVVLASQMRMTWRIASIYYQRPTARQMLYIYGNVGANVLVADNMADVDLSGIVTPIVTGIFPSLKGAVPGLQGISALLVNSTANGAANAFLTLRVGLITREYCAALVRPERAEVRKSATLTALGFIGDIAKEQGTRVVQAAWGGVSDAARSSVGRFLGKNPPSPPPAVQ